jgi:flagellar export protein FliJ
LRPGAFRYEALLEVYATQEDSLRGEIASLERERGALQGQIETFFRESQEARALLSQGGPVNEVETALRYIEGLRHWIEQSRGREEELQKRIQERMKDLQALRTERLRFAKLKERHNKQVYQKTKRLEQKVTDEFAQRKRNR